MAHDKLLRDVSKELKNYYERTRREEAFDLSSSNVPAYDLDTYKFRKLFGYSNVKDENMKHYFQPKGLKERMAFETYNIPSHEKVIKERLLSELGKSTDVFKDHPHLPKSSKKYGQQSALKSTKSRSVTRSADYSNTKISVSTSYIPLGLLAVRSRPTAHLTRGEKLRVIDTTTKLLTAADDVLFVSPYARYHGVSNRSASSHSKPPQHPPQHKPPLPQLLFNGTPKDLNSNEAQTNKTSTSRNEDFEPATIRHVTEIETIRSENTKKSSVSSQLSVRSGSAKEYKLDKTRPMSSKGPRKQKNASADSFDINALKERQDGPLYQYIVKVKTGTINSTDANIYIQLFGLHGKSQMIHLKDSLTHKIPFQRGNIDAFKVETREIGELKAISIGYDEFDISYSWYLDSVKIDDTLNDVFYVFECKNWLKSDAAEDITKRTLYVTSKDKIPLHKIVSQTDSNHSIDSARSLDKEDRISENTELKKKGKDTDEDTKESSRPSTRLSKVISSQSKSGAPEIDKLSDKRKVYSSSEDEEADEKPLVRNISNASLNKRVDSRASSGSKASLAKKVQPQEPNSGKMDDSLSLSTTGSESESDDTHDSELSALSSRTMTPVKDALEFEAITDCIRQGQVDELKKKLEEMPEIANVKDHMGQSLAILAAIRGNNDILRIVIEANRALPHQPSGTNYYPVHYCAKYGHLDCLKTLLQYGADATVLTSENYTILHLATLIGHVKICEYIVEKKIVDEDLKDFKDRTALKIAEDNDYNDLAEVLRRNKITQKAATPAKEVQREKNFLYDSASSESDNEELKKELASRKNASGNSSSDDLKNEKSKKMHDKNRNEIDSSASESDKEKKDKKKNLKKISDSSDSDY